jgi:hypothetical protein
MAAVCPRCSRRNPPEATFCYFDGAGLPGAGREGRLQIGSLAFPTPFVFPDGEMCGNFNQLVTSCQRHWDVARDLLHQGTMGPFLAAMGRLDLARAANNAAASSDPDRALDQLLAGLPSDVLEPPQLKVEPATISLGQLRPGADGQFDLVLVNQGMRLLYGAVASDCDWLALGDGAGHVQKVFQTPGEITIPVRVVGRKLRAQPRPFEGRLCVDSNGGSVIVVVRAEVTARPFPGGVLAGAMTPHDVAIKAKAHPREAALLFEQGAVEQWYQANGWTYPVQGPAGSGLGAVQQFFEALGLVRPPRVEVSDVAVHFRGTPGQRLRHNLNVGTQEKRPVFAHAWSDRPWLSVGPPQFQGSQVGLPLEITVPARPGETLEAKVTVRANGNQRFVVPITVQIDGSAVMPAQQGVHAVPILYAAQVAPAPPSQPRQKKRPRRRR